MSNLPVYIRQHLPPGEAHRQSRAARAVGAVVVSANRYGDVVEVVYAVPSAVSLARTAARSTLPQRRQSVEA